jgi:hypothetical protein
MDQRGLLTINFQSDIGLPSYIKREIDMKIKPNTANEESNKQRRDRRLGLFKKSDYEGEP